MPRDRKAYFAAYRERMKEERSAYQRAYRATNAKRLKERDAAYRDTHREHVKATNRAYKKAHSTEKAIADAQYRKTHRDELRQKSQEYYAINREAIKQRKLATKLEVFEHYGGAHCAKCGDDRISVLTIDHINQDGAVHRRTIQLKDKLCKWLKKNGYPEGYRVLCANCNLLAYFEHIAKTQSSNRKARQGRNKRLRIKTQFMALLGSQCVICSKNDIRILTAHHKNGDGKEHRESISGGKASYKFYQAILDTTNITEQLANLECRCLSCNCNEEWK